MFGLGIVVRGAQDSGLHAIVARLVPTVPAGLGPRSVLALLGIAAFAAVLANLVNNLPAVLILLPSVAAVGPV